MDKGQSFRLTQRVTLYVGLTFLTLKNLKSEHFQSKLSENSIWHKILVQAIGHFVGPRPSGSGVIDPKQCSARF